MGVDPRGRRSAASPPPLFSLVLLTMVALLCLGGCAGLGGSTPEGFVPPTVSRTIPGVPFHPQLDYQCGPASLAGVLNHLGDQATPEEISGAIFRKELQGTVSLDMTLYPRERGLQSRFFRGTPQSLAAAVDAGTPPVVMIDQGIGPVSLHHFMVVVGYTPEGIVANSGRDRETLVSWRSFLPQWSRAANWTLVVTR